MSKFKIKTILLLAASTVFAWSGCSKQEAINQDPDGNDSTARWITVSGALMQDEAGDGDGGTMIFSLTPEQAKDPNFSVNVFDQGMHVKSSRTARLQASADGQFLYNIQYTGDDGGVFNKYKVGGGKVFTPDGAEVETATYVSAAPRWLKAAEGVGVAVRAAAKDVVFTGSSPNFVYKERTAKTDVITLDLNNPQITKTTSFDLALSDQEIAAGYYVSRIDVPVINKAGDKVYIGVAVSQHNTSSFTLGEDGLPEFEAAKNSPKSWAKTLVLDYPSLTNQKLITSTLTRANTNGYRSTQQYIGTDGHVYQSTSGAGAGTGGSKILRIDATTNDYDDSFEFSLDQALGLTDTHIETWKYIGDGIGFVVYGIGGSGKGGYIARIDLNNKTATKYNLPNQDKLNFRQIQNLTIEGDEVFVAVAAIGQNGNIYVFNKDSGEMTVGAKLVNKTGNQYIGLY